MIDPIEPNLLSSLSSPSTPTPGQTSFSDMVQGMEQTAGKGTTEANLLDDWNKQLTDDQTAGTSARPHHKKAEENAMTAYLNNPVNTANPLATNITPDVDNTAAAGNSNTGSINSGTMI